MYYDHISIYCRHDIVFGCARRQSLLAYSIFGKKQAGRSKKTVNNDSINFRSLPLTVVIAVTYAPLIGVLVYD